MSHLPVRRAALLALAASMLFTGTTATAQDYPTRPVRIIVPIQAGGGYDFIGRALADKLTAELRQGVVVENRVGAGTVVGTQAAAAAAPDGYTLLVGGLANISFNPALYAKLPYDAANDFVPVAIVASFTYALVGRKDLPGGGVKDLIAYARANPGKLTLAHAGAGTGQHIAGALFRRAAGLDVVEVPYKGAQAAYTDILGGRVDVFFDNTTTARPFVDAGQVRALVTSGSTRDALMPNVPTAAEEGLKDVTLDSWIGLFAPARTPPAVLAKLRAAVDKVMQQPDLRQRLVANGWTITTMSTAEGERFVRAESAKWQAFIREAGIRAE